MKELVERFGESRISIIDIDGEKWIRASDCAKVLDYKNYRSTVSNFVETNKELLEGGVQKLYTPSKSGDQETWYFNDRGLIAFLIKTNQPKAIQFQKWAVNILSKEAKKEVFNKETDLRKKSKKVRVEFTDTLKAHGYKSPHEYIQTTYTIVFLMGLMSG